MTKRAANSGRTVTLPKENSATVAKKFIKDVLSGKELCCKWVKKAIERHEKDLTRLKKTYYFDEKAADVVLKTFYEYKHFKGKWAGDRFILLPWQQAVLYILFGWKNKKTGYRRFRTSYLEIARKNGKTFLSGGVGNYMLDMDGEAAAEVYSVATQREQAKIVHTDAKQMVKHSVHLKDYAKIYKDSIVVEDTASKFQPLSADYNTLDGLNVSCAIIDEFHAHKNRELFDVIDTATGARQQPLIFIITTAGISHESVCREMHDYVENILNEVVYDETVFGMIFTLDDGDDWADQNVWKKANPSLGASLSVDEIQERCNKAKNSSASKNAFLRLRMNIWTSSSEGWITLEDWKASAGEFDPETLTGQSCYLGMDLSSVSDLSSVCLEFPQEDGTVKALWRYYLPEDDLQERCRRDRVPYDLWAEQGYITLTPGKSIDYDFIEEELKQLATKYNIIEMAEDPYNATQLTNHLIAEGIKCIDMRQGFLSMSPPTKGLKRLILSKRFHHNNNPVSNWMITNCEVVTDPAGNEKLDKAAKVKRRKIDGIVAAVMAFSRIDAEPEKPSAYSDRGMLFV